MLFLLILPISCEEAAGIDHFLAISSIITQRKDTKFDISNILVDFDINFDFNNMEDDTTCKKGKTFINNNKDYVVSEEDCLVTDAKRIALKETLKNLKNFVKDSFLIHKPEKIEIFKYDVGKIGQTETEETSSHLSVMVFLQPIPGEGIITKIIKNDETSLRPTQGILSINPKVIPNKPQSYESKDGRKFFDILFKHLCFILGLNVDYVNNWMDPETEKLYQDRIIESCKVGQEKHLFITTPKIAELLEKRFLRTQFHQSCNKKAIGIEIENDDISGRNGLYLEHRVYFSEVLTSVYYGYSKISSITTSLLEATGYYVKKDSFIPEPLEFNDFKAIYPGFITREEIRNSHVEILPFYRFNSKETNYGHLVCSFDHRGLSDPNPIKVNKDHDFRYSKYSCFDKNFGNKSFSSFGNVSSRCSLSSLERKKNENDNRHPFPYASCYQMKCEGYNLKVFLDKWYNCEEGLQIKIDGYNGVFLCPNPKIVCAIDNYPNHQWYPNEIFNENTKLQQNDNDQEKYEENIESFTNQCKNVDKKYGKDYSLYEIHDNNNFELFSLGDNIIPNCYQVIEDILLNNKNEKIEFKLSDSLSDIVYFPYDLFFERSITVTADVYPIKKKIMLVNFQNKTDYNGVKTHAFKNILIDSEYNTLNFSNIKLKNSAFVGNIKVIAKETLNVDCNSYFVSFNNFMRVKRFVVDDDISKISPVTKHNDGIVSGCGTFSQKLTNETTSSLHFKVNDQPGSLSFQIIDSSNNDEMPINTFLKFNSDRPSIIFTKNNYNNIPNETKLKNLQVETKEGSKLDLHGISLSNLYHKTFKDESKENANIFGFVSIIVVGVSINAVAIFAVIYNYNKYKNSTKRDVEGFDF